MQYSEVVVLHIRLAAMFVCDHTHGTKDLYQFETGVKERECVCVCESTGVDESNLPFRMSIIFN